MDYLFLEKCVQELSPKLKGKRLGEAYLSGFRFSLKVGSGFLNCYLGVPNAFFYDEEPLTQEPFRRFNLKGFFLKGLSLPVKDRVVELELLKLSLSGDFQKRYLVLELTGKNANLFLLNEKREILYHLRPVLSSVRPLKVGAPYVFPPQNKKPFEELTFGEVTAEGVEKKLYKFVEGLSPLNAKEIAHYFRKLKDLEKAYRLFLERHASSSKACLYYAGEKPKYETTFPYESLKELPRKEFTGELPFSSCWKTYFREVVEKEEFERLKEAALKPLEKRLKALESELKEFQSPEKLLQEAERAKKLGELLKYNLHAIKAGSKEVLLYDYESQKELPVPLSPELSPKENMERYFKSYKKLLRKAERARQLSEKLQEEIRALKFLVERVKKAETFEELKPFLLKEKKGKTEVELPVRLFTLPSGKRLLVGKNSRGNELILKFASPHDYWFHAKEVQGSHVLLTVNKGEEPTQKELELAAAAAAYYSRGRESGKVKVDYTLAKFVKKPPNSKKGFVVYRNERTLIVKPEAFEELLKKEKAPEGAD